MRTTSIGSNSKKERHGVGKTLYKGLMSRRGKSSEYFRENSWIASEFAEAQSHGFRSVLGDPLNPWQKNVEMVERLARVSDITQWGTSARRNDDIKQIVFYDPKTPDIPQGYKLFFEKNYWLAVNVGNIDAVLKSAVIYRCHNTLNKRLSDGRIHKEPIFFPDYKASGTENLARARVSLEDGGLVCVAQANDFTAGIDNGDRFIVGGEAWRIKGKQNIIRTETMDKNSVGILYFGLYRDEEMYDDDMEEEVSRGAQEEAEHDDGRW